MEKTIFRHKEPYRVAGKWIVPMFLCWYHDIDEPDLHVQHCIQGIHESAEVTVHVHFEKDYMKDCEEVKWNDVPKVVQEEFIKAWKARAFNPS